MEIYRQYHATNHLMETRNLNSILLFSAFARQIRTLARHRLDNHFEFCKSHYQDKTRQIKEIIYQHQLAVCVESDSLSLYVG